MKRVDAREIPHGTKEIRAFLVVRNEMLRLPATLHHHRSLGVNRFFVLDNGSTDGTLDYLRGEPDVHAFSTSSSYAESNYGLTWTNELLDVFGSGHWTLTIDADEQFIFPHWERIALPQFCSFLDCLGAEAVPCLLLDMYPGVAIRDARHDPARPLLESCSYFDRMPYQMRRVNLCPYFEISGGVRERIFVQNGAQFHPPTISKVPLVRWKRGLQFLSSTHHLSDVKLAPILATLLHFKFLSDFHERAQTEVARGEHFENAREYRVYLQMCRENGRATLMCDRSEKFRGSTQLVALNLMSSPKPYEDWLRATPAPHALARELADVT
jgi:glycosyltransferase involved in cell wall biosynthesis